MSDSVYVMLNALHTGLIFIMVQYVQSMLVSLIYNLYFTSNLFRKS
jgi:hypothetical protein